MAKLHVAFQANAKIQISEIESGDTYRVSVSYDDSLLDVETTNNRFDAEERAAKMLRELGVVEEDIERIQEVLDCDGKMKIVKGQRANTTLSVYLG